MCGEDVVSYVCGGRWLQLPPWSTQHSKANTLHSLQMHLRAPVVLQPRPTCSPCTSDRSPGGWPASHAFSSTGLPSWSLAATASPAPPSLQERSACTSSRHVCRAHCKRGGGGWYAAALQTHTSPGRRDSSLGGHQHGEVGVGGLGGGQRHGAQHQRIHEPPLVHVWRLSVQRQVAVSAIV